MTVTLKFDLGKYQEVKEHYLPYFASDAPSGEYVDFIAEKDDVTITGYKSNKTYQKVLFNGENALLEAQIWDLDASANEKKESISEGWLCLDSQIGSDEVGVGDFLLPMIVVAAYINERDIYLLDRYGVHDSKKLTDKKILEIGPELVKKIKYSKLTLPNEKYNEMLEKDENLNSLKGRMHNRALLNLHKEYPEVVNIFVDQFVNEDKYYEYLSKDEEVVKNITFRTKGESYYPSVALASVIARYSFLLEKQKLEEKYQMEFPFGATSKADEFAKKFLEKYGKEEFDKIVKKNFKNYKNLIEK